MPTVRELAASYRAHLTESRTSAWLENNQHRVEGGLRPLVELFGSEWADDFGPRKLATLIAEMARPGRLSAASLRARLDHVRRAFRWAAATERVPASVWHAVQSVPNPRIGEFGLRGSHARQPVGEEAVFAILPELNPVVRAIVELLWWTGARPGEIRKLRPCEIDRSGIVWRATLELREERMTPLWPSHVARYERERAERDEQAVGDAYSSRSLSRAVDRAQDRVNRKRRESGAPPFERWTLYCIRHAALSRIRREEGLEAAKAFAGHSGMAMTLGYTTEAERDYAIDLAARLG